MITPDFAQSHAWYDANPELFAAGVNHLDTSVDRGRFLARLPENARVLDLGCGSGRDLEAFAAAGCRVTGIDPSAAMLDLCRRRLPEGTPLRQERAEDFADPSGSWDGIWAMASLIHVSFADQQAVLSNLVRSLAPGGIMMAWVKSLSRGWEESADPRGRPVCRYGTKHALDMLEEIPDLAPASFVCTVTHPDSRGEETSWTEIVIRKKTRR